MRISVLVLRELSDELPAAVRAFLLAKTLFPLSDVKSHAIVRDEDVDIPLRLIGADADRAALFLLHDAVADGVFHNRLQRQRRNPEIVLVDVVQHVQPLAEALLLQRDVIVDVLELTVERDRLFRRQSFHINSEKT